MFFVLHSSLMELHPGGIIFFLCIVFFFATIFSIGVIILLGYLKVVRIKRTGDYFVWGIVGGILISFIYVTLMCNKSTGAPDDVVREADTAIIVKQAYVPRFACELPKTFLRISLTRATGSLRIFCSSSPTW